MLYVACGPISWQSVNVRAGADAIAITVASAVADAVAIAVAVAAFCRNIPAMSKARRLSV